MGLQEEYTINTNHCWSLISQPCSCANLPKAIVTKDKAGSFSQPSRNACTLLHVCLRSESLEGLFLIFTNVQYYVVLFLSLAWTYTVFTHNKMKQSLMWDWYVVSLKFPFFLVIQQSGPNQQWVGVLQESIAVAVSVMHNAMHPVRAQHIRDTKCRRLRLDCCFIRWVKHLWDPPHYQAHVKNKLPKSNGSIALACDSQCSIGKPKTLNYHKPFNPEWKENVMISQLCKVLNFEPTVSPSKFQINLAIF